MATHSSVLAWRIHGQKSPASYSPYGHEESDTTEQHAGWHSQHSDLNSSTSISSYIFFCFTSVSHSHSKSQRELSRATPHLKWIVWPSPPFPLSLLQHSLATWTPLFSLSSPSSFPFSPHSGWMAGTLSDSLTFLSIPPPFQQQASSFPLFRGWIL